MTKVKLAMWSVTVSVSGLMPSLLPPQLEQSVKREPGRAPGQNGELRAKGRERHVLNKFVCTDVTASALRSLDPSLVSVHLMTARVSATIYWNRIQCRAAWQQRNSLRRTTMILQAASIKTCRGAVLVTD